MSSLPEGCTREQGIAFRKNHKAAIAYFESIGELPKDRKPYEYILHHKDPSWRHNDIDRYIQCNLEDLEVKKNGEHTREHMIGTAHASGKRSDESRERMRQAQLGNSNASGPRSEEVKAKMSKAQKDSYAKGDRVAWNKGLTKETDERVAAYGRKQSLNKKGNYNYA